MKKLFTFILASLFCLGLFATGPEVPLLDGDKNDLDNIELSNFYNYISDSCTNFYSILAIKDDRNKEYGILFTNQSCITDLSITLILSFKSEKELKLHLKDIDTIKLDKSFNELRTFIISQNIEPLTFYSYDNKNVTGQMYEYHY